MYPDYYETYLFILKRYGVVPNTPPQARVILHTLMDEGWTKVYSIKELVEYIHTSLQIMNCEVVINSIVRAYHGADWFHDRLYRVLIVLNKRKEVSSMDIINSINDIFMYLFVGGGYDMRWLGIPAVIIFTIQLIICTIWYGRDLIQQRKEVKRNGKN